jgi:hypothetical protein
MQLEDHHRKLHAAVRAVVVIQRLHDRRLKRRMLAAKMRRAKLKNQFANARVTMDEAEHKPSRQGSKNSPITTTLCSPDPSRGTKTLDAVEAASADDVEDLTSPGNALATGTRFSPGRVHATSASAHSCPHQPGLREVLPTLSGGAGAGMGAATAAGAGTSASTGADASADAGSADISGAIAKVAADAADAPQISADDHVSHHAAMANAQEDEAGMKEWLGKGGKGGKGLEHHAAKPEVEMEGEKTGGVKGGLKWMHGHLHPHMHPHMQVELRKVLHLHPHLHHHVSPHETSAHAPLNTHMHMHPHMDLYGHTMPAGLHPHVSLHLRMARMRWLHNMNVNAGHLPTRFKGLGHWIVHKVESSIFTSPEQTWWLTVHVDAIRTLVLSHGWEVWAGSAIGLNTLTLMCDRYPQPIGEKNALEMSNIIFTVWFALEIVLKLLGLGLFHFFRDGFNCFDTLIVIVGTVELAMAPPAVLVGKAAAAAAGGGGASGAISALRMLRIFRVFRIFAKATRLQRLLHVMLRVLHHLSDFGLIMFLYIYTFALLGMQFFANRFHFDEQGYGIDRSVQHGLEQMDRPRAHFDDLWSAISTVFQALSGEDWPQLQQAAWRAVGWPGCAFFVVLVVSGWVVLLNLFLAVLLGSFEEETRMKETVEAENSRAAASRAAAVAQQAAADAMLAYKRAVVVRAEQIADDEVAAKLSDELDARAIVDEDARLIVEAEAAAASELALAEQEAEQEKKALADRPKSIKVFPEGGGAAEPERLSLNARARAKCLKVTEHARFDQVVLVLIALSSVQLALESPLHDPNSSKAQVLWGADVCLTTCFTVELLIKVTALRTDFLKTGWNRLDLMCVLVSVIALVPIEGGDTAVVGGFRVLRAIRTFRPLRMLTHPRMAGMRMVVSVLFLAIPAVVHVISVMMLLFIIFAIVGVQLYHGAMHHCHGAVFEEWGMGNNGTNMGYLVHPVAWADLTAPQRTWGAGGAAAAAATAYASGESQTSKAVCDWVGGDWDSVLPQTFDNILAGISTLFEMSTTEGRAGITFVMVDSAGKEMQPIKGNNEAAAIYAFVLVILMSFFMLNLFVGVIIDEYNRLKRENESMLVTAEQRQWLDVHKMLLRIQPRRKWKRPEGEGLLMQLRGAAHDICYKQPNANKFEFAIAAAIVLNTVLMMSAHFGQPKWWTEALCNSGVFFAVVFTMEAALKLLGGGSKAYFDDSWSRFDILVVVGTDFGILLERGLGATCTNPSSDGGGALATLGPAIQILRIMRVGRVLRLLRSLKGLQRVFSTLLLTLPSLVNIASLLFLLFFIFAVLGVQLFAQVGLGEHLAPRANFQGMDVAFSTLFRCSTGEDWNAIMHDAANSPSTCSPQPMPYNKSVCGFEGHDEFDCVPLTGCGTALAYPFFVLFSLLVTFIFVNLFVAVILEAFAESAEDGKKQEKKAADAVALDLHKKKVLSTVGRAFLGIQMTEEQTQFLVAQAEEKAALVHRPLEFEDVQELYKQLCLRWAEVDDELDWLISEGQFHTLMAVLPKPLGLEMLTPHGEGAPTGMADMRHRLRHLAVVLEDTEDDWTSEAVVNRRQSDVSNRGPSSMAIGQFFVDAEKNPAKLAEDTRRTSAANDKRLSAAKVEAEAKAESEVKAAAAAKVAAAEAAVGVGVAAGAGAGVAAGAEAAAEETPGGEGAGATSLPGTPCCEMSSSASLDSVQTRQQHGAADVYVVTHVDEAPGQGGGCSRATSSR